MAALTSYASKLLTNYNKNRAFCLSKPQIRFFRISKLYNNDFSHSISLHFKPIESISSSFSSKTQANVSDAEAMTETTNQSKTVPVKFQLQKECLFGQQFLITGDDPILGLWDPENAIPLDWSDEHVWTVELDIPIGKSILYKFILKGATEEVEWQPGPDRILQIFETKNTIIISEDWENAESQKITEEVPSKDLIANPEIKLIDAENTMACENKEATIAPESSTAYLKEEPNADPYKELVSTEKKTMKEEKPLAKPKEDFLVAQNILGRNDITIVNPGDDKLFDDVREPVLVPGLTPLPNITNGDVFSTKAENKSTMDASSGADEDEDHGMPEKHAKQECDGNPHQEETIQKTIDDGHKDEQHDNWFEENIHLNTEQEQLNCQTANNDVLENDFQWGRKALNKLLTSLGFSSEHT